MTPQELNAMLFPWLALLAVVLVMLVLVVALVAAVWDIVAFFRRRR